MTMWRKTLIYLGLVEEPDEYDEVAERSYRPPQGQEPRREPRREPARQAGGPTPMADRERDRDGEGTVQPLRRAEPGSAHVRPMARAGLGARVQVVAVEDFERGAEEIGRQYRMGTPVLFDMAEAVGPDPRRILDFVSGVTFALRGRMEKVGPRAFLIVPDGVDLTPEERSRLVSLGYGG